MGKAKDGSECYTRQNKTGGSYVTCEGTQKSRKSGGGSKKPATKEKPKAKQTDGKPKEKVNWNRSDTVRGKSRRAAKAKKLTTRPAAAGRIDTGAPRNVGKVVTEKPKFKDDKPKKSMTEGQKVLAALHPWQRNKGVVKSVEIYSDPERKHYGSGPKLSEDAVKKFNRLNKIPKNPKKYLVADIQGRKPNRFVGAQNELIRVIDKEKRDKNNIKVTFHQFDTWEKAIQYIDFLKKVSAEEKKKYEPLSRIQRERIAKMTAENGVAITPQNNNSFKYGFGFVGVSPFASLRQDPTMAITADDAPSYSDINYKLKKKKK